MQTTHNFHSTVLREYDIRGIVGKTINSQDAEMIGRCYGTMVRQQGGKSVAVGYDGRLSSPELEAALVQGLLSTGLKIFRVGMGPTPMVYFATRHLNTAGGVMITGSHNPPDYNGFKMVLGKLPLYGSDIQAIGQMAKSGSYQSADGGSIENVDVKAAYIDRLLKDYTTNKPISAVWDAGNGATGEIMQLLTARLPGNHPCLFAEIDGRFPNHHPDPTVEANVQDLRREMQQRNISVGIAFDGDGDRIGVMDGKGRLLAGDQLLAIYAQEVLAAHPGATIVADVKSSQMLFDEVTRLGGKPIMWKTGHSLLKVKMAEEKSPLAGEVSCHIMFGDHYYGFDDALYCAIRLLNLLGNRSESLTDIVDRLPQPLITPEIRFQVSEERKFKVIEEIRDRLQKIGATVNAIDGVRVSTADGWWLLRASNTQDALTARVESYTKDGLTRLKDMLSHELEQSGLAAPDFSAASGH